MICYNCGYQLHTVEEAECGLCGAKFTQKCASCDSPNSEFSKFCAFCGSRLSESSDKSSVENYETLSENRKNVAVIFADVSGFTKLSESLDPEEVREIINDCFNYITRPVYEMEGTIDKFIGDCVMILFGARYTHADDAKRAVMCAMEMMELIKDFNENYLSSRGIALNLSIGVNYGLVVTGSVGNYFDKDYTVLGDAVNTAQRLQSGAGEGTILVSESVYHKTHDVISYSRAKDIQAKNKKKPIKCYIPLNINSDYSFETELPFMERQSEIDLLDIIYKKSVSGITQVVSVVGEAGVGKTRLVKEYLSTVESSVKKIWADCSHVSQNRSYYLISAILKQIMNINPTDSDSVEQHRLLTFLNFIMPQSTEEEVRRARDFLGLMMGMRRDNDFTNILNSMNINDIKREMAKQLAVFFINYSRQNSFVIIVDDIHWADEVSLQILNDTLPLISGAGILLIFTSRVDMRKLLPWISIEKNYVLIGTISAESTAKLACRLIGCSELCEMLRDAVIKLTRGNPLYIKEYVAAIKRSGKYTVEDGVACLDEDAVYSLPDNLQSLVLASMSELDDASREFLQVASVVGKDFSLSFVKSIMGNENEDDDILRQPMLMNIVTLKSVNVRTGKVEKEYSFNHEIEKDAIYDSILNRKKREYHGKTAEYIESAFHRDIEDYYELLCMHFEKAGMASKAREYYYKTAIKHKDEFNLNTSLNYYLKYLEAPPTKTTGDKSKVVIALRDVGYIYHVTANYELALEYYTRAKSASWLSDDINSVELMRAEIYRDMGNYEAALEILNRLEQIIRLEDSLFGKLLQIKCNILRITGNPDALALAKKSEKILLKAKDYRNLSETMKNAGIIYYSKGDIDNSLSFLNKAYTYAEKVNNLEGMAKISGDLGIIYHSTGQISRAQEFLNKSLEISQKISYPRGYIAACINLGVLYLDKGLFEKAEHLFKEALAMSEEIGLKLYECISLTNLGDIMHERNLQGKALEYYKRSQSLAREINAPVEEGINMMGTARVMLKKGKFSGIEELLETAHKIFVEADEIMYLCDYHILKGKYEMAMGNAAKALESSEEAAALSVECRSDKKKLKAMRSQGWILIERGMTGEALELFELAAKLSIRIESDYETAKSYYGMFKALYSSQNIPEAKVYLSKADEHIKKVDNCRWTKIILFASRTLRIK